MNKLINIYKDGIILKPDIIAEKPRPSSKL